CRIGARLPLIRKHPRLEQQRASGPSLLLRNFRKRAHAVASLSLGASPLVEFEVSVEEESDLPVTEIHNRCAISRIQLSRVLGRKRAKGLSVFSGRAASSATIAMTCSMVI